ncbi:NAD(P)H-nitrite reductase [Candidatus Methanoperedens nitroreducens]|uniref:NAD(P)H-nitrite reductase n=1 Tax=Candidatus Methanoperedens nitratireducens TaxID=1392998 RepID=A0A062V658_9EURY|nr:hypothetical protein [Candidatus Methanoperedens nitroreducens]KCZ70870.1 NAD(P)H-nitrite reductase [Candidatus Methanoperedens nitroreducens]MDJ1420725.1 hypothetical protein [Candidatus Methanoperedens sp.]
MVDAIAEQTNGVVAILPATPAGLITSKQLEKIAKIANDGAGLVKLTSMQRMAILVKKEQIDSVRDELAGVDMKIGVVGKREVWNPMGCTGALCKYARQDALADAIAIAAHAGTKAPRQVKIGVSGCQNSCAWSKVVDIGLVGTKDGYDVYIGGDAGRNPRIGQKLKNVSKEDAVSVVKEIVDKFNTYGKDGEHLYQVIERLGLDVF